MVYQQIAQTVAVSIGKIARLDYDAEWASLPDDLLAIMSQALAANSFVVLHRTLLATKEVVKLLVINRMPRGRKLMQQVSSPSSSASVRALTCRVKDRSKAVYSPRQLV